LLTSRTLEMETLIAEANTTLGVKDESSPKYAELANLGNIGALNSKLRAAVTGLRALLARIHSSALCLTTTHRQVLDKLYAAAELDKIERDLEAQVAVADAVSAQLSAFRDELVEERQQAEETERQREQQRNEKERERNAAQQERMNLRLALFGTALGVAGLSGLVSLANPEKAPFRARLIEVAGISVLALMAVLYLVLIQHRSKRGRQKRGEAES
jgi:hypothetical protein